MLRLLRILFGYIARTAPLIRGRGSDQWPIEKATVYSSKASDLFPGGLAEIVYSYSHKGQYFSGIHEKQFGSYFDATRYAAGFPKGLQIVVRVKPERPKTSILRHTDQDQTAMRLRSRFD
jgi:hypothetical protein